MPQITDIQEKKRMREFMAMFWEMVDKDTKTECWIWKGETNQCTTNGKTYTYGVFFRHPNNEQRLGKTYAHRFAWALKHRITLREVTPLRRTCNRALCVNPEHWAQAKLHPSKQLRELRAKSRIYRALLRKFAQA
jgi:hypothetical protein